MGTGGVRRFPLHVFFQRPSVRGDADGHRVGRVPIGSLHTITGATVLVQQGEAVSCTAKTWKLLGYDAQDADGRTVRRSASDNPAAASC